jgi:hypothetical protein
MLSQVISRPAGIRHVRRKAPLGPNPGCPERERLHRKTTAAGNLHCVTVSALSEAVANGKHSDHELAVLKREIRRSLEDVTRAWDEYRLHLEEHGCLTPPEWAGCAERRSMGV